jgi:hypothetical protein
MTDLVELDLSFSTTLYVIKTDLQQMAEMVKQSSVMTKCYLGRTHPLERN